MSDHRQAGVNLIRVYGFHQLGRLVEDNQVNDVILAMPSVPRARRREIISMLEPYAIHISTLPGLDDLASGKVEVNDIREVGVSDLLGRDAVEPDLDLLHANVKSKVVLVTGAGGSIGSELCRQILKIGPERLILYERGEYDLYTIENELLRQAEQPDQEPEKESQEQP